MYHVAYENAFTGLQLSTNILIILMDKAIFIFIVQHFHTFVEYDCERFWSNMFYCVTKSPPCSKCMIHVDNVCVISRTVALRDMP